MSVRRSSSHTDPVTDRTAGEDGPGSPGPESEGPGSPPTALAALTAATVGLRLGGGADAPGTLAAALADLWGAAVSVRAADGTGTARLGTPPPGAEPVVLAVPPGVSHPGGTVEVLADPRTARGIRVGSGPAAAHLATVWDSLVLQRRHAEARELADRRAEVLNTLAHELKTPVALLGNLSRLLRLRRGQLPLERIDTSLEAIERQAGRMERLVTDLLELSRLDSGRLPVTLEPVDLWGLVCGAVDALEAHGRVDNRVPPGVVVVADPHYGEVLLANLIGNALKHGGGADVRVLHRTGPGAVEVVVEDDGPGVPPEIATELFDWFVRGSGDRGTGLGLAIVRQLAVAFGGSVRHEPVEPHGARFVVTLRPA